MAALRKAVQIVPWVEDGAHIVCQKICMILSNVWRRYSEVEGQISYFSVFSLDVDEKLFLFQRVSRHHQQTPYLACNMSRRDLILSITTIALSAALVVLLPGINSVANALQVTFPSASSNWVSCKLNVLTWSAESTDPEYFSVELLNKDDVSRRFAQSFQFQILISSDTLHRNY